ncbi:4536_t:CDS:2 [Paraglomus occultum]|uniref:4536_t:CDS:1 n=1 Tax=Paraglomus occultum TaxID=144539 RepID=A0A9N9FDH7_9GLOM|nr:4536_t:CDS:2 [Paraglomus occultum]
MSFIHTNKPRTLANLFDDLDLSDESVGENTVYSEAVPLTGRPIERDTRHSYLTEEASFGRENTQRDCKCASCLLAVTPSFRADFDNVRRVFSSEKLLRQAAVFAGTRTIRDKIEDYFHATWAHPLHLGIPIVQSVSFMSNDKQLCERFDEYLSELAFDNIEPNVKPLWHGTNVRCLLGNEPCNSESDDACASCNILRKGFDLNKSGSAHPYRSYADSRNHHNAYTILFCWVALGRDFATSEDLPHLTEPPYRYHSIHGTVGPRLNYEEYVIYRTDAAVPFAAVTYKVKDNI